MKTFIPLFVFMLLFQGANAFETGGILKAVVNGDSVVLKDDSCRRNCTAIYQMQVSANAFHIIWFQKDYGAIANCDCGYNLSTTIINLSPGTYIADVYYNSLDYEMDSIYVGNIQFTITTGDGSYYKVNPYQSDCFYIPLGVEHQGDKGLNPAVYPNPFCVTIRIPYDNRGLESDELVILNLYGEIVFSVAIPANKEGSIVWDGRSSLGSSLLPGAYLCFTRNSSVPPQKLILLK